MSGHARCITKNQLFRVVFIVYHYIIRQLVAVVFLKTSGSMAEAGANQVVSYLGLTGVFPKPADFG